MISEIESVKLERVAAFECYRMTGLHLVGALAFSPHDFGPMNYGSIQLRSEVSEDGTKETVHLESVTENADFFLISKELALDPSSIGIPKFLEFVAIDPINNVLLFARIDRNPRLPAQSKRWIRWSRFKFSVSKMVYRLCHFFRLCSVTDSGAYGWSGVSWFWQRGSSNAK